jgi:hypothetical protein
MWLCVLHVDESVVVVIVIVMVLFSQQYSTVYHVSSAHLARELLSSVDPTNDGALFSSKSLYVLRVVSSVASANLLVTNT